MVRFSPDGRWVASCARDEESGVVRLWDLTAGKLLKAMPVSRERPQVWAARMEFSPREFVLACAGSDRVVRLYDVELFAPIAATPPDATAPVKSLAFSPSGKSIVAATENGVRQWSRWDSPTPRLVLFESLGWDQLKQVAVAGGRGGKCIAVCSAASFVSVWEYGIELDPEDDDEEDCGKNDMSSCHGAADAKLELVRVNSHKASTPADPSAPTRKQHQAPRISRQTPVEASALADAKAPDVAKTASADAKVPIIEVKPPWPLQRETTAVDNVPLALRSAQDSTDCQRCDRELAPEKAKRAKPKLDDTASLLTEVLLGRSSSRVLEARLEVLRSASKDWAKGEARRAVRSVHEACRKSSDADVVERWALASDFLGAIDSASPSLDLVVDFLDLISDMLADYSERASADDYDTLKLAPRHVKLAIELARHSFDLYGGLVRTTLANLRPNGIDLAADDRRAKCETVRTSFVAIARHLPAIRTTFQSNRHIDSTSLELHTKLRDCFRVCPRSDSPNESPS